MNTRYHYFGAGGVSPRLQCGFTIVEVMIVVIIIGILMAIGLPAYNDSLQKGRRSDAKAGLMDAANRQEQLLLDRSTYTTDMAQLGYPADPLISDEGHYSIDTAACGAGTIATCYVLTADARASSPQAKDSRCLQFQLDSTGAKTATSGDCW